MSAQGELNFGNQCSEKGYVKWVTSRRVASKEVARRLGLPLGHQVEVWLTGEIRLRGRLRLQEELLFVDEESARHLGLAVDQVKFTYREMLSCIRTD